jgi:hypothetical protein
VQVGERSFEWHFVFPESIMQVVQETLGLVQITSCLREVGYQPIPQQ